MRPGTRWFAATFVVVAVAGSMFARAVAAQERSDREVRSAHAILERALQALGPQEAADRLAGLVLRGSGTRTSIGQGGSPGHPAGTSPLTMEWILDFTNGRARRTSATYQHDLPYFAITSRFSRERTFHIEDVTTVLFQVPGAAAEASRAAALRRFPEPRGRLLDALAASATVMAPERRVVDGVAVDVVDVQFENGQRWSLLIDAATSLVRRVERADPVRMPLDTLPLSIEYGEYRTVAGLQMPSRVRETTPSGSTIGSVRVDEYHFGEMRAVARVDDSVFAVPRMAFPRQSDGQPTFREVAQDVVFIENARPNYNQLAVAFDDYLLVVDAPFNGVVSDTILAMLGKRFPGKPVRYVVPTHFHFDHMGGLPSYVEVGARVVTTPGNADFMRDVVRRSAVFRGRQPPAVGIDEVRDSLVIADAHHAVVLYAIEPTEHVDHMLLVTVPSAGLLYVADVVSADWGRLRPAIPETFQFADAIKRLGITLDRILPGHGPPVDRAGLEWALEEGRLMQHREG